MVIPSLCPFAPRRSYAGWATPSSAAPTSGPNAWLADPVSSAEEKGFEPLVPLPVRRFSKPLPSTARPLLRTVEVLALSRPRGDRRRAGHSLLLLPLLLLLLQAAKRATTAIAAHPMDLPLFISTSQA